MDRRNSYRMDKVNSEMQKTLSTIINSEIRNPVLDDLVITVTEVQTAPDFSSAKVFVSTLKSQVESSQLIKELEEASGFIKKRINEELNLKRIPALKFIYDDSMEQGDRIMQLLESIKNKEE